MNAISVLADISLILVVVEFMLLAAIPLGVLYFVVRGMHWLNAHVRPWLRRVRAGVNKVRDAVERGSRAAAKPFIVASAYVAQAQGLARGVGKALSGRSWRFKEGQ